MNRLFAIALLCSAGLYGQIVLSPASIPDVLVGGSVNIQLTSTGNSTPLTYSFATGTPPPGLSLSTSGLLSGTLFSPGAYTFEVQGSLQPPQEGFGSRVYTMRVVSFSCPDTNARIGQSYSSTAFVSPLGANFTQTSGSLPPGLSFAVGGNGGALSGTPTALGTYNFTLQANYSTPPGSVSRQCTIHVNQAFEYKEPRTTARVGVPYRSAVSVFEGIGPLNFTVQSGSLPPGLVLSGSTGLLTGTPTVAGSYAATVSITDSQSRVIQAPVPINVLARAESPVAMRCPLEVGRGGNFYSSALSISAAVSSFAITSGSLPSGLTLNSATGQISGIGGSAAFGSFTATANLMGGGTVSANCSISFSEGSTVSASASCPDQSDLVVGEAYSSRVIGAGNRRPFLFSLYSSSLPPGLSLNSNGIVSGTPLFTGNYEAYFIATDNDFSDGYTEPCYFNVAPPPPFSITTTTLPNGQVGIPYNFQLQTSGGVAPITFYESSGSVGMQFSLAAGQSGGSKAPRFFAASASNPPSTGGSSSLPPGLTLSSAGLISGVPTQAGTYNFAVYAVDNVFQYDYRAYSITIFVPDPLRFNSRTIGSGTVGIAYSQSFDIAGGALPYSLLITNGALPPGMRLTGTSLTGTPTVAGGWPFTLQVTDSVGSVITGDFTLNVAQGSFRLGCPAFEAEIGAPFSSTPVVLGGRSPYQFSITAGSLPPGLTLNPTTGEVSGRATTAGPYPFTLSVTDATPSTTAARCGIGVIGGPLRILTTGPVTTVAGKPYSGAIETVGGQAPYAISVVGPSAPGLSVAANGTLSGTAARIGDFNVVVTARDAAGATVQRALVFRNTASDLRFSCPLPAEINAGTASAASVQISAGLAPYTLALASGALPAGLSIGTPGPNGATPIAGVATVTGDFNLNLRASDSTGTTVTQSCPLKISGALLTLVTDSLPNARVGVDYSASLVANGGVTPLLFGASGGSLPPGIGIDPATGALSGIPTKAGTYTANYSVRDRVGQNATRALSVIVEDAPLSLSIITAAPLSDGMVGRPYAQSFAADGGTPPYSFSLSGELPNGLSFNDGIAGTPTAPGVGNVTVTVRDNAGATAQRSYAVRVLIDPALNIVTDSLPDGVLDEPYVAAVTAAGGTAPYSWTLINGSLPAGVTFDSSLGRLVGTAASNGQFEALILVQDANGDVSRRAYSFEVRPAGVEKLEITTASLAAASVGVPYTGPLGARGGVEPYTWELRGVLPQGMTQNGGAITGTGTRVETARFLVVVTDSLGFVARRELSLGVAATTAPAITINGLGDALNSNLNAPFNVAVTRPLGAPANVRLTLRFTPDNIHNTDDPNIRFGNNSRTFDFVIPAGASSVSLPSGASVQTGTLAGTIIVSAEFNVGGTTLPGPSQTILVRRAVPVIGAVRLTRAAGSVEVRVEGFTNTRQLTEARITFTFANNVDVTGSATATVNVSSAIQAWFANAASIPFGGQFGLTLPFNVTGDPANVTGVSVVVTNGEGASNSVSAQ